MAEGRWYNLEICGLVRRLPIIEVSPGVAIASFVVLGDTELVIAAAAALVAKLPPVDALISAEAKGIPLIHEMSRLLGMNYFVARKSAKPYMEEPLLDEVVSMTTQKKQVLCLDGRDARQLRGKRVAVVDDVISTGESVAAVERLVTRAGGTVVAKAAILAEGDAVKRPDILYLGELPLFRNS